MSDSKSEIKLDESSVNTVVHLAQHMRALRDSAADLQLAFETRSRGFFTPSEDDQVLNLWVSYHKSRAALLDLVHSIRRDAGTASRENAGDFLAAYAAALVLVDAARCLRDRFSQNDLVRRKLNEAYQAYGIAEGSFDEVQWSLTDPANALALKQANEFFDQHRKFFEADASRIAGLKSILDVIANSGESTRVDTARYVRALAIERGRQTRDQLLLGSVSRLVYAIQEWGSRLVSDISTIPNHVPSVPEEIRGSFRPLLQPGDVFVTRKENAMTNYFLPGYWPHAAMYVGEDCVIESLKDGVRQRKMESPFGNDAIALIRPRVDRKVIDAAIERARTHLGKPYDFNFDFTRADRMVCTEVVYRSYEGLGGIKFQLKRRAGRETLSAEDLLSLAIRQEWFENVAVYCPMVSSNLLVGEEMDAVLKKTMANPYG